MKAILMSPVLLFSIFFTNQLCRAEVRGRVYPQHYTPVPVTNPRSNTDIHLGPAPALNGEYTVLRQVSPGAPLVLTEVRVVDGIVVSDRVVSRYVEGSALGLPTSNRVSVNEVRVVPNGYSQYRSGNCQVITGNRDDGIPSVVRCYPNHTGAAPAVSTYQTPPSNHFVVPAVPASVSDRPPPSDSHFQETQNRQLGKNSQPEKSSGSLDWPRVKIMPYTPPPRKGPEYSRYKSSTLGPIGR